MKKSIFISFMVVLCLSLFSGTNVFAQGPGAGDPNIVWGSESNPGNFCQVEKVNVCVVTKNIDDCKKLNGKKVVTCPENKKEEAK